MTSPFSPCRHLLPSPWRFARRTFNLFHKELTKMPRITNDPTKETCPSFEGEGWDFLRQAVVATHQGDVPLTDEQVLQRIKDAWRLDHETRVAAWNTQLEQDQADLEELERQAHEEEEAQRARLEREAEEQRREAERKKPKLNPFDPNRRVSSWIEPRPAAYAINKINSLEYVELDYFTVRGCTEAASDPNRSISLDTYAFTRLDDAIALRPMAAQRPSKNIREDHELAWDEMLEAKNTMLHHIAKSGVWPKPHAESLAAFFVNLELHPRRLQPHGRKAILLYQSKVRQEWFCALKRKQGFNIELIEEELLRSCHETVTIEIREKEFEQVRHHPCLSLPCPLTMTFPDTLPQCAHPAYTCYPQTAIHSSNGYCFLKRLSFPQTAIPFLKRLYFPQTAMSSPQTAIYFSSNGYFLKRLFPQTAISSNGYFPKRLFSSSNNQYITSDHNVTQMVINWPFPTLTQQMRKLAHTSFAIHEPSAPRYTPRQHRDRGWESHSRARSISPARGGTSRKRYRSRSPPRADDSPHHQTEKTSRDYSGRSKRDRGEFFRPGAGPRGGVCAVCLGRHEHDFGKCEARRLWDGSAGTARKGEGGKLISTSGLPLCFDWQLPAGCQSTYHSDRHRCSGCGKASHGAQTCPRAQKA